MFVGKLYPQKKKKKKSLWVTRVALTVRLGSCGEFIRVDID